MRTPRTAAFNSISVDLGKFRQRFTALFLFVLIIFGAGSQTALALATSSDLNASDLTQVNTTPNDHKTSTAPSIGTINNSPVPAPDTSLKSSATAAADATMPASGSATTAFLGQLTGKVNDQAISPAYTPKPRLTPHELTDKRTATSSEYLNANGTITKTTYFSSHYYQSNGSWQPIDNTLVTDDNAADSGNIFGQALGAVESWVSSPSAYNTQANDWEARFTPSDFSGGMVRIKQGNSQVGFSPVNANTVSPVITTDAQGKQTVHYDNLWNSVDVEYTVESDQVKEAIILKDKSAAAEVQFQIVGADLQKPSTTGNPGDAQPAFMIHGALGDQFGVTPANLVLNNLGYVDSATSGLTQQYANGTLTVGINGSYLQSLPDKAFPAVIDPTVTSSFGSRSGGSYKSFETNGTICSAGTCDLYAGGNYDTNNVWQNWRGAFYSPYTMFQLKGVTLNSADLHMTQLTGNWWTGDTSSYNFQVGNATCLTGYSCMDRTWDSGNVTTTGDIDVTNIYQNLISGNNWGGWLMLAGDDGTGTRSFKAFDPDNTYITFTYTTALSSPSFIVPQNNQVVTDPQASFTLNTETNPNNGTPLQYQFQVTDGSNSNGVVVNSGGFLNSTHWTVPDGVLHDGSTYYVEAQSYDSSTGYTSPWSTPVAFKIDMRKGQDKTQTYDTIGPAKVDLVTGNLETSNASHTTKALAGSIGITLDYNSSLKSRPGLVGSYWNLPNGGSGIPSTTPDLQRVDQNVDFNWGPWGGSSPGSPGTPINSTYFAAQWSGYFVAPATGTFYFGGTHDDWLAITVNGQQVYNASICSSSTPCFGSGISLTAGQVVSFQSSYNQYGGADYAHIYVSGAVTQQVVPQAWFQTGVRAVQSNNGLIGKYYTYTDTGNPPTFPSDGTTGLFLTRTDSLINFNWNSGPPIANGPQSDFMVRWAGYVTVPVTGSYTFGTQSDDGSDITVNGQSVYSKWHDDGADTTGFGSAVSLNAGQSYPITVDYYQHTGADTMSLLVEPLSGPSEVVPSTWLSPRAQVLPNGWGLGVDPDGNNVSYTYLTVNQNNVVLTDSSGDTYDYTWNGSGYTPPANSYGRLIRNIDGSFTLQDADGKTYTFDSSGTLTSVTNPVDDQHPAALQYTYGAINGGPVGLQKITDGTTSNRYMNVFYSGASQCGTPPSGFGSTPTNMICAVQTNDGRTTYFYYDTNGNLAEVAAPGNEDTTYQYQSVSNASGTVIGYQLVSIRDSLANDAVVEGTRANDSTTYTQISYDVLGRVTSVAQPAATAGATQLTKTIGYDTPYWQSPTDINDSIASGSSPVSVSWGTNSVYLFARGTAGDLIYKDWNGSTWTSWASLGGCIQGDPSATSWGSGRIDVAVEGCGTSDNLWLMTYTNGAWQSWYNLGNGVGVGSAPAITNIGVNQLQIFAKESGNNNLYHLWGSPSTSWGGGGAGENLGGCISGQPTASNWGTSRIDVFAKDCSANGNNLDQLTWDSTNGWHAWTTDALHITNTPSAASLTSGQIDLVTTDSNNHVQQATYTQSGSWTGWTQLAMCSTARPSLSYRQIDLSGSNAYDLFAQSCQPSSTEVYRQVFTQPINTTLEHITGATEPAGYSEMVQYDDLFRTTKVYDSQGLATTTEWDPVKDLSYSMTNPEGQMTTTVYDDDDRAISTYGPAPSSWFNRWSYTLANYTSMTEGQALWSPDHRFEFIFQTDGNVVLYGPSGAIWASNTSNPQTNLIIQTDGNMVLFNGNTPTWASGTNIGNGSGPSTYLAVQNDGNVELYNASGPVWSTNTGGQGPSPTQSGYDTPLSSYTNQVARTDTVYDQNLTGLGVAYMAVNESSTNNASLVQAPLLHSTNIASDGTMSHAWSTPPVTTSNGNWGFSMTGTMRLPDTGSWGFQTLVDNGVRLWVDGQLVIDSWKDNPYPTTSPGTVTATGYYNNTVANSLHRVRIDYYHLTASSSATFQLVMQDPANNKGTWTNQVAQYFSPDYSLTTSSISYDNTVGNATTTTSYGNTPELGLDTSSTVNSGGLNLTTSKSYETPGTGYLRQTSQTSPGGSTTNYSYYAGSDTATNPCVQNSAAAYQGGMLKTETYPSPDGGTTPGKVLTYVYDDAGNVVAQQTNSDGWECKTFDARGRLTQDVVPAFNGQASRTITYNYNVGGNPLVSSVTDSSGTVTTTVDLLGRTVDYTDVNNDTTTTTYDNLGRMSSQATQMGTINYTYDSYNRLTDEQLGSTDEAKPNYDAYGRLASVSYPSAGSLTDTITYDPNTGVENSAKYTLANGINVTDSVTRTQSGKISQDSVTNGTTTLNSSYTYDLADRLTGATVGSNTYAYGYGTQNSSCGTGSNMNANSGMNSDRTSQTINGTTTTYCYNYADQLVSSSDPSANTAVYDSHGNMTQLGSGTSPLYLQYDASDRNSSIQQYNSLGNGMAMNYARDALDRIMTRTEASIANNTQTVTNTYHYDYTGSDDSPDYVRNGSWTITEEYLSLPGGVVQTIYPQKTGSSASSYDLPNIHGDTLLTTDASGTNTSNGPGPSSSFAYDPFGNPLPGSSDPANTDSGSFGYEGSHLKFTETDFALTPIQMGARVYLPTIGRFASMDPVEGGNANTYAYPTDPVDASDLTGDIAYVKDAITTYHIVCGQGWWQLTCIPVGGLAGKVFEYGFKGAQIADRGGRAAEFIRNGNDLLRIGKGRIAIGPAESHYGKGGIASKVPYHLEYSWRNKKIFLENVKTRKTLFCRGRNCH